MKSINNCALTINRGSSSIKFALYESDGSLTRLLFGEMENMGLKNTRLNYNYSDAIQKISVDIKAVDQDAATHEMMDWLEKQEGFTSVNAIGHRIVQGMKHTEPELITDELLAELKAFSAYDPEHLPFEIKLIELLKKRYPAIPQIACFDTSFHGSMPAIAKL